MRPLFCLGLLCLPIWLLAQPSISQIEKHFSQILAGPGHRTHQDLPALNRAGDYIHTIFSSYSSHVEEQVYLVEGRQYRNVLASFGPRDTPRIVVGAHYDVCGRQPGADDNASGVVGLLELARLLASAELHYRIDLVAYTLEEPPYFRTEHMGSHVHAQKLAEEQSEVIGMVSLEMIGYFRQERRSQRYPLGLLKWWYGSRGNYITVVSKWGGGKFSRDFSRRMRQTTGVPVKVFRGPSSLPGIDFSDHANYWKFGFSGIMITDTAFYRNPHYHQSSDTLDTLDLISMKSVIGQVFEVLVHLAAGPFPA